MMGLLRKTSRISGANRERPEFAQFTLKATIFQLTLGEPLASAKPKPLVQFRCRLPRRNASPMPPRKAPQKKPLSRNGAAGSPTIFGAKR